MSAADGAEVKLFQVAETLPVDVLEKMHAKDATKAFAHVPAMMDRDNRALTNWQSHDSKGSMSPKLPKSWLDKPRDKFTNGGGQHVANAHTATDHIRFQLARCERVQ